MCSLTGALPPAEDMMTTLTPRRKVAGSLARRFASTLVFALLAGPCLAADLVAKLEAPRVSGPAPLAVMVDATNTTARAGLDVFRELTYTFDFGDERGLTWPHSGKPRNTQSGAPLAAHVYDEPGTYTVKVDVKAPDGQTSSATLEITVEDPNAAYPGNKTVCVSPSGAFDGCPKGALRDRELPRTYVGKRVLLHRGESFGIVSINRNSDGIVVGSYGSGAKPIVQQVFINNGRLNNEFVDDLTIMDLDISDGIMHVASGSRYLFYRNELTRPGGNNAIDVGGALDYMAEHNPRLSFYNPREIFIVENVIRGQVDASKKPFINLTGVGKYYAIVGNDISRAYEHTVRLWSIHKGFIAHNALRGFSHSDSGGSIRSVLKLHSGGLLPYADDFAVAKGKWATSQIVVADNLMGDEQNNGFFTAGVAPQNILPGTAEGIEDVIIERNRFIRGPYTNTEMQNVGRRVTTRDNTRVDGGVPQLSIGPTSPDLPPEWIGPYYRQ